MITSTVTELTEQLDTIQTELRKLADLRSEFLRREHAIRKELYELRGPSPCPICSQPLDMNGMCENPKCPDYVPF